MIGDLFCIAISLWLLRFGWDNILLPFVNYGRTLAGKKEWPRIKPLKNKK